MTERDEPYKAEAWRMSGYYPDAYARFMASLGVGIDYDDADFARYEAEFRADLAAHDEAVRAEERERCARIAESHEKHTIHPWVPRSIARRIREQGKEQDA